VPQSGTPPVTFDFAPVSPTESVSDATRIQERPPAQPFGVRSPIQVPGYVVTHEIARGGMGVVYAAHDPVFDREVAIKVMHPGQDANRFVIESKVTAQLPHPGVPPVYALGTLADGRPFLAMKLIRGHTLAHELNAPDLPRLLGSFERICQTVGFAHARGIVHRDLKPANVMVGAFGEVLVMDWGLAKEVRTAEQRPADPVTESPTRTERNDGGSVTETLNGARYEQTAAGQVKGTPAYMAPEQARGEPVGPPADVFALGGILAAVLTGKPPFVGQSVLDTVLMAAQAELGDAFVRLDACNADAELVELAKRCLAARAADRYPNAEELAAAVSAYRAGVEERLRRAELDRAAAESGAREQRKRRRVQVALAATVAGFLAVAGVVEKRRAERELADEKAAAERDRADAEQKARAERADADRRQTEARLSGQIEAEQRFKAEQARRGVRAGLALATDLRTQLKFKPADAALAQAAESARGAPELLPEVEQARRGLAFVTRLDDIRYSKCIWNPAAGVAGGFQRSSVGPAYRAAFAAHGLDLTALEPAEAAGHIATSPVRAEIVAAVDDWSVYEPDPDLRNRLLQIARQVDPGPWTDRLRDPAVRGDKAAVAKLAADADAATVSPAALSTLAEVMSRAGLNPTAMLVAARDRHPTDFELAFVLGMWYTSNGPPGRSIGPYEAARALRPDNVAVLNNLGDAHRMAGNTAAAIAAQRESVRLDPSNPVSYLNLGVALSDTSNQAAAADAFREAIRLDPNSAQGYIGLGIVLDRMRNAPGALAAFREAVKLAPTNAQALVCLGDALAAGGDSPGALAAYREATRVRPDYVNAHFHLGLLLNARRERDAAIGAFREVIRLQPGYTDAHINLGLLLSDRREWDAAGAAFREAIRLAPRQPIPHAGWGDVLRAKGRLDEATAAYREAIELDPNCTAARTGLGLALLVDKGNLLRAKGRLDEATAAYREAIELDPNYTAARTGLGLALFDKGNVDDALAAFREALRLDPNNARNHFNLGNALRAKRQLADAVAAHKEAVRLDPTVALYHTNLGVALIAKGDADGATAALTRAVEIDPTDPQNHRNLGWLYGQLKRYPEAIACLRAAIERAPRYAEAHGLLGEALFRSGDVSGARAALTEAARLDNRWAPVLARLPALEVAPPPHEKQ
jgi:tetratricopeptide (TPR) repeat protein